MSAPTSTIFGMEVGNYKKTYLDDQGVFVSTILRESSAIEGPCHYFETMVFPYRETEILWESAAGSKREADRQHALAVRYFARPWRAAVLRETEQ